MKELIGLWLFGLAITILITFLEPVLTTKEKVKLVVCIMVFITLIFVGAYLIAGGGAE